MGTDFNPLEWENAKLMAEAIITRQSEPRSLDQFYLDFTSYLSEKYGKATVRSGKELTFILGEKEYILDLDVKEDGLVQVLTKIFYEVFYKDLF